MGSTFFFCSWKYLRSAPVISRAEIGEAAGLANKEYHHMPPRRCLAVGHVQVLTFYLPFFQLANARPRKKDCLDLIRANRVFPGNLGDKLFVPDHIVKAQGQRSFTVSRVAVLKLRLPRPATGGIIHPVGATSRRHKLTVAINFSFSKTRGKQIRSRMVDTV